MNEPNALRLAKWLDAMPSSGYALTNQAAAELRRLHEVNHELLEALKHARTLVDEWGNCASQYEQERYGLQSDLLMLDVAITKGEQA